MAVKKDRRRARKPVPDGRTDEEQAEAQREEEETEEAKERQSPGNAVIYKAVQQEGEDELSRPSSALAWSGLAAGLSMGFSLVAEGLLHSYLPAAHWRPLIAKFGYSVGFLIVILGRQQLFTENTLTVMLPLLRRKDLATLLNVLRLWAIVLASNLAGALAFALVIGHTDAFDADVKQAFVELGHKAMEHGFGTALLRGIFAGWLIALMVWLLPFAEAGRVYVIILVTYVVGLAHLTHVVAGAVEVLYLPVVGEKPWGVVVGGYIVPALLGNIIGGVALVAALNHAQVVAGEIGEHE